MKRRYFLLLPVLVPFFMVLACHGDKAIINQTQLPNIDMGQGGLPQGQDQNQITPPGGINSGGNQPPPGEPLGGPEIFVPGGPEPEIVQVRPEPREEPAEEPPAEEEPPAPELPATPYEVVSREGGRDIAASSCFDFSVPTISGGNSIPTVVYEQNGSSRRKLVVAERSGNVWRPHTLLIVEGVSGSQDCFFKPTLFMDEGQPYVTAKGSGNSLKMFTRLVGGVGWVDISPESTTIGSSNISMRRVGGILKMAYKASNNRPSITCHSLVAPPGCSRQVNTIVPDTEAHLALLPWLWNEECEKILRFAGADDSVGDVLILKFCGERNETPAIHLSLPDVIKHPAFFMGPGDDRFTVVYALPSSLLVRFCQFDSEGVVISESCENMGAVGEHPSIVAGVDGTIAVSYTFQNGIRLARKEAGSWHREILARSQGRFNLGKASRVQLAPVGGVLHTHIIYTAYDYAGRMTTLRYSVIP